MASGGGLTDLILRCLVFWFGFRCCSFEEGISMAFDGLVKTFQVQYRYAEKPAKETLN